MKNVPLSSCADIVGKLSIPKAGHVSKPEVVTEDKAVSYRPFEQEIVQEIQFTYVFREKKTKTMITETNVTGL